MEIITSLTSGHRSSCAAMSPNRNRGKIRQFAVDGLMATEESCALMREVASSKNIRAGETLFWEGDASNYAYFLTDGTMKAYKLLPNGRSQIVRFITAEEMIASTGHESHTYSTQALGACTILQLPRLRFENIMAQDPILVKSIANKLAKELQQSQKQILLLGRMPAIERVSSFLLDIAAKQHPHNDAPDDDLHIELPMARSDIADYLGLTIETVSRAFSNFRRNGLIDLPRPNLVHLCDQSGLQRQSAPKNF